MKGKKKALILSGGGARGAYQVGVWKYLQEIGWNPDIVCGSSVGAINAAAVASSLEMDTLESIWKKMERGQVYKMGSLTDLLLKFKKKNFTPLLNSKPLEDTLSESIDFKKLRRSPMEVIITAVSVLDSTLHFFNKKQITLDHVMASSAIPVLFPWRILKNQPFWDGGVMMNTPLLPALKAGASEIIMVLHSPVGGSSLKTPLDSQDVLERVFEQTLIGSFQSTLVCAGLNVSKSKLSQYGLNIRIISPRRMMGFQSLLNFSSRQCEGLILEGYEDARQSLRGFFQKKQSSKSRTRRAGRKK